MTFIVNSEDAGAGRLIRSDRRGRVLMPLEQREALLDAFEQSGQSGVAFCRQHGLKYPTFAVWVQRRRRKQGVGSSPPSPSHLSGFVEVEFDARSRSDVTPSTALCVTLPDGIRVDITCRSHLSWVAELL